MDKEQSLALYKQGREKWNEWANGLLAEKKRQEEAGEWEAEKEKWEDEATADFQDHTFDESADFKEFIFPGLTQFSHTEFLGGAVFLDAIFFGEVYFHRVTFLKTTVFAKAIFFRDALFSNMTFSEFAFFHDTYFFENAAFGGSTFIGPANFANAKFIANPDIPGASARSTSFMAINSKKFFNLDGAKFEKVPDFTQAHFLEAPSLDKITIGPKARENPTRPLRQSPSPLRGGIKGGGQDKKQIPSRWRHLRRLATQGQDHENEGYFFAEELKSRRGVFDFPRGKNWQRWWAGILYEKFSDFGRSIWRPLWIWLSVTIAYASILLATHDFIAKSRQPFELGPNGCLLGDSTPWSTALKVAFDNALFLPQFGVSNGQVQENLCLFGYDTGLKMPNLPPVPLVPGWIAGLGFAHALFSVAMVFLILLAIRNQFRIR